MRNFRANGFSVWRAVGLASFGALIAASPACRDEGPGTSTTQQAPAPTAQGGVRLNPLTLRAVRPVLQRYGRDRAAMEMSAAPRATAAPTASVSTPPGAGASGQ